jgi:hypothetical protein
MAIASIGARSSGVSGVSSTTVTQTPGAIVAVGRQLVVQVSYSNASNLTVAVTDQVGNTYVEKAHFGSGAARVAVFVCNVTAQLASTTVITATFSSAIVDKTIDSWEFSVAAGTVLDEATAETTVAVNPAANGLGSVAHSGLSSAARLYFRASAKIVGSTATITATTNFTSKALAIRSRNNASAVSPRGEFRINTSTGETSNPTWAVSGVSATAFLALAEVLPAATGTLSKTLDAVTTSAAGAVPIAGSASGALTGASVSAAGTAPVVGAGSLTLEGVGLSAAGTAQDASVNGSLSVALDAASATGVGAVPIAGTAGASLDAVTGSGGGAVRISGSGSTSLDSVVVSAAGAVRAVGEGASTLEGVSTSGAGSVVVVGAGASTLDGAGSEGAGAVFVTGTGSVSLEGATLTGGGGAETLPAIEGSLAATLDSVTASGEGAVPVTGGAAVTLSTASTGEGVVTISGSVSASLDGVSLVAEGGALENLKPITGAGDVTLEDAGVEASGKLPNRGFASITLGVVRSAMPAPARQLRAFTGAFGRFVVVWRNGRRVVERAPPRRRRP